MGGFKFLFITMMTEAPVWKNYNEKNIDTKIVRDFWMDFNNLAGGPIYSRLNVEN